MDKQEKLLIEIRDELKNLNVQIKWVIEKAKNAEENDRGNEAHIQTIVNPTRKGRQWDILGGALIILGLTAYALLSK
ncbi:hypothetical protein ACJJIW_13235 [Microbulbifer sp. JMSA004]|uniref:hypothetical protein n=1 Tax=Microbulbifer sp. JMSA004 TaxID=3243370 RepID=UPI00403905EB